MRMIFMGTPDFAVQSLEALHRHNEIEVVAVVTQPDRPRGRGQKMQAPPVKEKAVELGLEVLQVENVNHPDFVDRLKAYRPAAVVIVAFGQKLGTDILHLAEYGCINLHASLLPEYRGASPIHQAIIDGRKETGITTMMVDDGWDTGDIIYQQKVKIAREDTVGILHDKLAVRGAELLVKTLLDLVQDQPPVKEQDEEKATYAAKINKQTGEIDWSATAEDIYNLVRGVNPWPGAFTTYRGKILKIWWVSPLEPDEAVSGQGRDFGEVLTANEERGLIIKAGKGLIRLERVQPAGRNRMSGRDFLRGYQIDNGEILGV